MSGLWRINVYDVETTIKGVVNKVLAKDAHSDKTKRQTAAHAIMEMGQIFQVGLLRCSMQKQRGAGKCRVCLCTLKDLGSCPSQSGAGTTGLSWVCRLQLQVWHLQEGLKLPQAGLLLL